MKLILSIITVLGWLSFSALAQQRPQLSQYMQNNYLINPAVAGIESYADVRSGIRQQWAGVDGAPTSMYITMQMALNKNDRNAKPLNLRNNGKEISSFRRSASANKNNRFYVNPHHGLGAIMQTDKAGLLRSSSLNISYAYHLPLTGGLNLSGGVYTGLLQYNINRNDLVVQTPDDPFLYSDALNIHKLDLGLGLWLYGRDFYLGVSGAHLIGSSNDVFQPERGARAILQPHYFVTSGYRVKVSENFNFTPSVMYKLTAGGQNAVDVNLKTYYFDRVWAGISYRHEDAVASMIGVHINPLIDVSYSYDFSTYKMNPVNANSHEVVLGIKLNNPNRIICPQWVW